MKKLFILFFLLAVISPISAQKLKHGIEYKYNIDAIKQASYIVWYGWDFSHSKMRDFKKFQEGELIVGKHIPAIIGKLSVSYLEKRVRNATKKDSVIFNRVTINELYKEIDPKSFVVINPYELTPNDIKKIVSNYSLPQKEGLGLVVIIEMMNDEKDPFRYASGYVTFFDIATRDVYYTTKMKGLPGSKWGFDDYWFNGFTELFDYFFADYYNKIYK